MVHFLIDVHVGLHIPNQLMGNDLRSLGDVLDELYHVAHLREKRTIRLRMCNEEGLGGLPTYRVMSQGLHQLGNVGKNGFSWVRVQSRNGVLCGQRMRRELT